MIHKTPNYSSGMRDASKMTSQEKDALIEELISELAWEADLFSNVSMSPAQKLILWGLRQERRVKKPREDGLIPLYVPNVVNRIGVSDDTVGKSLHTLADSGVVDRKIVSVADASAPFKKQLLVNFTEQTLINPSQVVLKNERNHGGKRIKLCPECGSSNQEKLERITCRGCGCVLHEVRSDVNESDGDYVHPVFEEGPPEMARIVETETVVGSVEETPTITPPVETYCGSDHTWDYIKDLYIPLSALLPFEGEYRDMEGYFIGRSQYYSMLHDEIKSEDPTRINAVVSLMESIKANGGPL